MNLARVIEDELGSCRILAPKLPLRWHDCVDLKELAAEILAKLGAVDLARYERLYIVGHSAGGVLAQAVYLLSRLQRETAESHHRRSRADQTGCRSS